MAFREWPYEPTGHDYVDLAMACLICGADVNEKRTNRHTAWHAARDEYWEPETKETA